MNVVPSMSSTRWFGRTYNFVPAAYVPRGNVDVLVLHRLHVEANSWDGGHNISEF